MKNHSNYSLVAALMAAASLTTLTACAIDDKIDPDKGIVDDSPPPGTPNDGPATGKADGAANVIAYTIESAHPYTNNLDRTYTLDLASVVPSCASQVKVHFAMLRTEAGYDFVSVIDGNGGVVQTFDGTHDNVWSEWVTLSSSRQMAIRLDTDYSIVRDGFRVDALEWAGQVTCPAAPVYDCGTTGIDLRKPAPACGCEEISHCTPLTDVVITHSIGGGFTGAMGGKRTVGLSAYRYDYAPASGEQTTLVGSLDAAAFREFAMWLASSGVLYGPGRADSSNWTECFSIATDQESVSYCAPAGSHDASIAAAIGRFEELTTCPGSLTCGDGYACTDGACAEDSCVCTAQYDPVCGVDGRTYGNACTAGCADVAVKHAGECGITGDACGTLLGLVCATDYKCRYGEGQFEAPYPDAGGTCVAASYCDAPPDCEGLPHVAVPGVWACVSNLCQWQAGEPWTEVASWRFESAHPYGNNISTWKQLYLPAGATRMRLAAQGTFDLELNYDFLEVWTWKNGAWSRVKRYTGTTAPAATDVFPGQYHYLKFVTDSSVTRHGFAVTAQYSNM